MNTTRPDDYDVEQETASIVRMLDESIPARLHEAYRLLGENAQHFESWRADLLVKLLRNVEGNCRELRETIGKDKLPAAAWIARNLLELWVWIKYCSASRDKAWRFHEDALRDLKGLSELQKELCELHGIEDETSEIAAQRIKAVASEQLGLDDVDSDYLAVRKAAAAEGVNLGCQYSASHRFLSKFAHPTAGLVIGIMHQDETRPEMQAVCTTQGVHFAAQGILAVEGILAAEAPTMWVFGYGSLMWDGWEQPFGGTRVDRAVLVGHRRSFNKKSVTNWGTSAAPGPTLGLEPAQNADCTGTAFEFPEEQRTAVENLLRVREGASFTLDVLPVRLPDGRDVRALTPVNDRTKSTYIGNIPMAQRGDMAKTARGTGGACADYIRKIHEKLTSLGIVDADVEEFAALIGHAAKIA